MNGAARRSLLPSYPGMSLTGAVLGRFRRAEVADPGTASCNRELRRPTGNIPFWTQN